MADRERQLSDDQQRLLSDIVAQYLDDLRRGTNPQRDALANQYPDLAPFLAQRLEFVDEAFQQVGGGEGLTFPANDSMPTAALPDIGSIGDDSGSSPPTVESDVPDGDGALPIHGEHAMGVRCPNCGQKIQVVTPVSDEVTCRSCGSTFHFDSAIVSAAPRIRQPKFIGRFKVLDTLGHGGFGVVYKATDPQLSRMVAIKVPRSGYFVTDEDERRFLREARSAARLRHPHIVRILEIDHEGGVPFIVSEYVEGRTLADLVTGQRLPHRDAAGLVIQIADALEYAHQEQVIHRDIKPSNILLDGADHAFLTDFGLVRDGDAEATVTLDGQVLGTPRFMSPEQAAGEHSRIDGRSDVYSLGVVLYQLLSGELPFRGSRRMLIEQVIHDDPPPLRKVNDTIPRDLETVTMKAMAKEPQSRYASSKEFGSDLRRWLNGETIVARPVGPFGRFVRWCKRNPTIAALCGIIALILAGVAIGAVVVAVREAGLRQAAIETQAQAEANEHQSRKRLVQLHLQNGVDRLVSNDLIHSLLPFSAAFHADFVEQQQMGHHQQRLGMVLDQCPKLVQLWDGRGIVNYAAFSRDGRLVLAASDAGMLLVWDARTGQPVCSDLQHDGSVTFGVFNSNATRVVSVSVDQVAHIWNVETGERVARLPHDAQVAHAAFSDNDKIVVTTSLDYHARIWDAESGQLIHELKHPGKNVAQVVFAPGSEHLVTLSQDVDLPAPGEIRIWNSTTGQPVGKPMQHAGFVWRVLYSQDGATLVSVGEDKTARFWKAADGEPLGDPLMHDSSVRRVFFVDDGQSVLTVAGDGRIRKWNVANGALEDDRLRLDCPLTDAAISNDGSLIMLGDSDGNVRIWWSTAAHQLGPTLVHGNVVSSVDFDEDQRRVLTASRDGTIRLWDLSSVVPQMPVLSQQGPLTMACYNADSTRVLTTGRDNTAHVWNALTAEELLPALEHAGEVLHGRFSPTDGLIATACADGAAQLWNANTGEAVGPRLDHAEAVQHVAFSPDGLRLATAGMDGTVKIWDTNSFELLFVLNHKEEVISVVFSEDGQLIATASVDQTARIWQATDGAPLTDPLQHKGVVFDASFSSDSRYLVTASGDRTAAIWNVETGQRIEPPMQLRATAVRAVFDREVMHVLVGDFGGTATVWGMPPSTSPEWSFSDPNPGVRAVVYGPEAKLVAVAKLSRNEINLDAGSAQVWNVIDGAPVSPPLRHWAGVRTVEFDGQGRFVLTASEDGTARTWPLTSIDLASDQMVQVARALSGKRLDSHYKMIAMPADELQALYHQVRDQHPELFHSTPEELAAWQRYQQEVEGRTER